MTETKQLTCVGCPAGCMITIELDGDNILSITGNTCDIGEQYARQEAVMPMRILTSTVKVTDCPYRVLPVTTDREIPLKMIGQAMEIIRTTVVKAPVSFEQVIIENLLDTGANVIASRSLPALH